jgi:XTP/dITP diphosphohydrolase
MDATDPVTEKPAPGGSVVEGCAVVVVDEQLGEVVPAAAVPALRRAAVVLADEGVPARALGAEPAPPVEQLRRRAAGEPVVLAVLHRDSAVARALIEAGAAVFAAERPAGAELLDAVGVMDRLRSPGGCPWDGEQTHDSLRRHLVEETYELLDAIEDGDRAAMREELGDVLLQVLFHARVAAEHADDPFDVDTVAVDLVSKLVSRHPHVFAADEGEQHDPEASYRRWEELKQQEKRRESVVDGVPTGQPAVALAAKLVQRARRAGLPDGLIPADGGSTGDALFATAARASAAGEDPEDLLRAAALRFADQIRAAEGRAKRHGAELDADAWRTFWTA